MLSKDNPEAARLDELDKLLAATRASTAATNLAGVAQAFALASIARSLAIVAENTKPWDGSTVRKLGMVVRDTFDEADEPDEDLSGLSVDEALALLDPEGAGEELSIERPKKKSKGKKKGKKSKAARPVKRDKTFDALAELKRTKGFSQVPPPPRKPNPREIDKMIKINDPELGSD